MVCCARSSSKPPSLNGSAACSSGTVPSSLGDDDRRVPGVGLGLTRVQVRDAAHGQAGQVADLWCLSALGHGDRRAWIVAGWSTARSRLPRLRQRDRSAGAAPRIRDLHQLSGRRTRYRSNAARRNRRRPIPVPVGRRIAGRNRHSPRSPVRPAGAPGVRSGTNEQTKCTTNRVDLTRSPSRSGPATSTGPPEPPARDTNPPSAERCPLGPPRRMLLTL